jgi:hypothetical protein
VPVVAGPVRVVAGLVSVVAGLVLGACLGAVQWMPGLAAVGASQRGAGSVAFFNSGSLPHRWLLLMLVPDLMGGSGSFGQPAFFANYNLAEVTGYVGILPLVAAAVLLGRIRLRPRLPEWAVWHLMALVGVVLALGGNTPFGSLLVHLPLFGGQRLQSRNILVADLALAVLFAYWADHPFSERSHRFLGQQTRWFLGQGSQQLPSQGSQQFPIEKSQQFPGEKSQRFLAGRSQRFLGGRRQQTRRAPPGRRMDLETVLGVVPPLAVIAVVVLGLVWGASLLHWLRAGPGAVGVDGRLKPWLVPYAVLGAGAVAFVIFGRRLRPGQRSRWLAGLVAIDLVVFTLLGVVAALPGLAAAPTPRPAAAPARQPPRSRPAVAGTGQRHKRPPAPSRRWDIRGVSRSMTPTCSMLTSYSSSARRISTSSAPRRRSRGTRQRSTATTRRRPGHTRPWAKGRMSSIPGPWVTGPSTSSTPRSCSRRPRT